MTKIKQFFLKNNMEWHKFLGWAGGLTLIIFTISGLTHPLMSWTGPKAAAFFPPQAVMNTDDVSAIPIILKRHSIDNALMVKIVPSLNKNVLQVTQENNVPRRYFDLSSHDELLNYDKTHAIWLAKYYTGFENEKIKEIIFQDKFDDSYPWVNRLLPVYKVNFDSEDNRTVFIYTELNALGSITNDYKTSVQSIFRALHTWSWLDGWEHGRVIILSLLTLSLFAMAVTGTALIFSLKNRKMDSKRKAHRYIAYLVWIPILFFSSSGFYHLLHYAYSDHHRGLKLSEPLSFSMNRFGTNPINLEQYKLTKLNAISIVEDEKGSLLYRLSLPLSKNKSSITRNMKYDGTPIEKSAIFFNTTTGEESFVTDKDMAIHYAAKQLEIDNKKITNVEKITRFGIHYDFRNKRLPVWQIDYDTNLGDKVFIDPATGILVDRLVNNDRYEGYSFSFLHKWNFLSPFIGRENRDYVMVFFLVLALISTIIGFKMLLNKRNN